MKTRMSKVFVIAGLLVFSAMGVQGQTWKYPKVENGNTIVSRDVAGGIKSDALLTATQKRFLMNQTTQPIYNEQSEYNKVSAKFQVASTDASTSSAWANAYTLCKSYSTGAAAGSWRVPTQKELMLMWMFKSKLTGCGNIVTTSGDFWSSTENSNNASNAWSVYFSTGSTPSYGKPGDSSVRCVRDL